MTRSEIMSRIRSRGNESTEKRMCAKLLKMGIGGWILHAPVTGKPDIAFMDEKIAVFLDGCFWHGCPEHYHPPKTRMRFWMKKIQTNRKRDETVVEKLVGDGWKIFRIWEHDICDEAELAGHALRIARATEDHQSEPAKSFELVEAELSGALYKIKCWRCKRHTIQEEKTLSADGSQNETTCLECFAKLRWDGHRSYKGGI